MKMTVKELKEILETMRDDRKIVIVVDGKEFTLDSFRKTKCTNELRFNVKELEF
jgi:hypothetical protein